MTRRFIQIHFLHQILVTERLPFASTEEHQNQRGGVQAVDISRELQLRASLTGIQLEENHSLLRRPMLELHVGRIQSG